MYLPKRFENQNESESLKLIAENPLATVISIEDGLPFVSHLPLIFEKEGEKAYLLGHLAKANPHWKMLDEKPAYVIFHGPQAYITPSWYQENDVPTWNYAVVHVRGQAQIFQDSGKLLDALAKLSTHAEKNFSNPWKFWIPDDLSAPGVLEKAIVGFRISVDFIDAKFKLSQNRSEADRLGVMKGLAEQADGQSEKVLSLMKGLYDGVGKKI